MKKVGYIVLLRDMWKRCNRFITGRGKMIGKAPLCNLKPERAPHIHGKVFILCWRCSMVIIGFIIAHILYFYRMVDLKLERWQAGILLCPLIIDGFTQRYTVYESSNLKRIITGLMFGVGLYYTCFAIYAC